MSRKGAIEWLAFVVTRGIAVLIALDVLRHHAGVVNVSPWGAYADAIRHGQLPYKDFDVLYPPGLLYVSWLGSLLPATAFHSVIIVVVFAFEAATLAFLQRVPAEGWLTPARAYVLMGALAPLQFIQLYGLGAFYDAMPAAMLAVSLVLLEKNKTTAALAALAAGILLKTYPIVAAPFVLLYIARRDRSFAAAAKAAVILGAMIAVPLVPLAMIDARGLLESYSYLGRRPLEWETLAGLLVHWTGDTGVALWPDAEAFTRHLPTYGWGFFAIHGAHDKIIASVMSLTFLLSMLGLIALAWRRLDTWPALARCSLASVVLLLVTAKVFSPLYIAWLFPLLALTQTDSKRATRAIYALGALIGALTTILTVWTFGPQPIGYALVAVRSVVMVALVGVIVRVESVARPHRP